MDMKKAYLDKIQAQMKEQQAEIEKLRAKTQQLEADARLNYQNQMEELDSKMHQANERVVELKQAGGGAWNELKSGAEIAWKDLSSAINKASSKFK